MDLGDFETTIKVIVVGNGSVGKSSMTARYCKGTYTDTYKKTIGVDFLEKTIDLTNEGGESVKLMIWDTAGQEEFDALTSSYYRGAGACALVFSTDDRASFDAIPRWKRKVEDECGVIQMVLVQNKVDLIQKAVATPQEVEQLARKLNLKLYRCCVKENVNVAEVFEHLASQYILHGGDTSGVGAVAAIGDYDKDAEGKTASNRAKEEHDRKLQRDLEPVVDDQRDDKDHNANRAPGTDGAEPAQQPRSPPHGHQVGAFKLTAEQPPGGKKAAKKKGAWSMC